MVVLRPGEGEGAPQDLAADRHAITAVRSVDVRGDASDLGGQLGRDPLVGVHGEDPVAASHRQPGVALAGEVVEGPHTDDVGLASSDGESAVAAGRVDHHDPLVGPAGRGQAIRQVRGLVPRPRAPRCAALHTRPARSSRYSREGEPPGEPAFLGGVLGRASRHGEEARREPRPPECPAPTSLVGRASLPASRHGEEARREPRPPESRSESPRVEAQPWRHPFLIAPANVRTGK